jgi:CRP/FNR family cyclic AMP-dependent transcriptional regulator
MAEKDLLAQCGIFQGLDDNDLEKVRAIAHEKYFLENEIIFSEGDEGEAMYLIMEGTVRVEKGESGLEGSAGTVEVIAVLYPSEVFGEIAIMDRETRSATVAANEPIKALEIRREDFEELLASDKDLALKCYRNFIRLLCHRLRSTNESLSFARTLLEGLMAKEKEQKA